jgi:microcystin-dependent protein
MYRLLLGIAVFALGIGSSTAWAQVVGERIPFHGYLEHNGAPVVGPIDMVFFIHSTPDEAAAPPGDEASALWSEEHLGVEVIAGEYSVMLGSSVPLIGLGAEDSLFFSIAVKDPADSAYAPLLGRRTMGSVLPQGLIAIWSGPVSGIPAGWALCDGSSGTPDLTARFVYGATSDGDAGEIGGQSSFSLATANLPSHAHSYSATSGSTNAPDYFSTRGGTTGIQCGCGGSCSEVHTYGVRSNNPHTHSVSGTTGGTGSGTAVAHVPPYFRLAYIMKL